MRRLVLMALLLAACSSTTTSIQDPTPAACGANTFSYSVGVTEGAAGTSYTPLILTNTSDRECTVEGLVVAQPVAGQEPVGPESKHNDVGDVTKEVLKPGGKANVMFAVATASNYPADECTPLESDGVTVTFKTDNSEVTTTFSMPGFEVCTALASTSISAVTAGSGG